MTTKADLERLVQAADSAAFFDEEGFCKLCGRTHREGCPVRELRRAVAPFTGSDKPIAQGAFL